MRLIFLTVVLTGFLSFPVFAGEPAGFSFSERSVYSFRYNAANNLPLNNYFVKEIARFNYLNLYKTNYQLDYEFRIYLQEINDTAVSVNCSITPLALKGDVFYEQFNLSDVMIPSVCDFVINVQDAQKRNTASIQVSDCQVSTSPENVFTLKGFIPDNKPAFEISDVRFKYLPGNKTLFEQRVSAINHYLACLELAKFAMNKPRSINPDTRENTLTAFCKIHDLQRLLTYLNRQDHSRLTDIPLHYASEFKSNVEFLDSQVRRLTTIFYQNMDTLTISLNSDDYLAAATQIIEIQKGYLKALTRANYLFEPVFMAMAHYFPRPDGWSALMDEMKSLYKNDATTRQRIQPEVFGKLLISSYIKETDSLIAGENFTDAVLMLESAEIACEDMSDDDCGLNVFHRLSLSKYGIYDSYISVARSAIEAGNLNLAYKYLLMARDFQKNNSNLIITAGQVNTDLEKLAQLLLDVGRGTDYSHLTDENLEYLDKAWEIYQMINVHDFDHIITRLLQKYNYE